ncbi:MAG: hypothetical protein J7621_04170 [Niastella sp.]|nr:hypothetical protein [Niastella sp.]
MTKEPKKTTTSNDCFVIMPIADAEGYEKGHFKRVYEDIFKAACTKAGFNAIRADEVKQTNLIHLDILQKLIESPMAICDLSTRNPNVLFELGLRQAFDKPTILVQEIGTPKIFDISPLRYAEYRKELKYREVLEDQEFICETLKATKQATDNGEGINSIISLLSLSSPASLKEVSENDATKMLQIVMSEMNDLRADFRQSVRRIDQKETQVEAGGYSDNYYSEFKNAYLKLRVLIENNASVEEVKITYDKLQHLYTKIPVKHLLLTRQIRSKEMIADADLLFSKFIAAGDK